MSLNHETQPVSCNMFREHSGKRVSRYSTTLLYDPHGRSPKIVVGEDTYEVGSLQRYSHNSRTGPHIRSLDDQSTIQALWNKLYSSSGLQGLVLGCGILILYMATTPLFQCDKMPAFASTPPQPELLLGSP